MAMENSKASSNIRSFIYPGKHAPLPPKSPFPSVSSAYVDYFIPTPLNGSKAVQKPRDVHIQHHHHQRTSSESFLMDEQPSWLDDLLNEPETPVRRGGHRRSSSDSFAYLDNFGRQDFTAQEEFQPMASVASWRSQDFDRFNDGWRAPSVKQKNAVSHFSTGLTSSRDDAQEGGRIAKQKHDQGESSSSADSKASSDSRETTSQAKPSSASETDTKRTKQQFAQRSRVRKLQYIAELERNVQALQVEGSEVTAELEFLNQQNLILSMENKALKQRLESLAQEQMIKYFEHEVLEREIGRLRALYQQQHQQQQQKQPSSSHRHSTSKDLDSQFANLSLKHKDQNPSTDKACLFSLEIFSQAYGEPIVAKAPPTKPLPLYF